MVRGTRNGHAGAMTSIPPEAPSGQPDPTQGPTRGPTTQGPRVTRDEVRDLGRLRRSTEDRRIAGVAGGLARHLDIDPVIVRVAFVVLVFFGGAGLVLYAACWLLVPADDRDRAALGFDERNRTIALVLVGAFAVLLVLGDAWGGQHWFGWPLILLGVVALVLIGRRQPEDSAGRPPPPTAPYAPPASAPYGPPPVRAPVVPRNPRRRGPILFWFTLALVTLLEGLLGTVDLAGVDVSATAYPALAVATIGTMLLVGAFYGRAGGLVLLGLLATLVLGGVSAADSWDGGDHVLHTPVRAAHVQDTYRIAAGELVLDLREVADLRALDGRTVHLYGDLGRLEVIVPPRLAAVVSATIDAGDVVIFGSERGGLGFTAHGRSPGEVSGETRETTGERTGRSAPELRIEAELGLGEIEVHS